MITKRLLFTYEKVTKMCLFFFVYKTYIFFSYIKHIYLSLLNVLLVGFRHNLLLRRSSKIDSVKEEKHRSSERSFSHFLLLTQELMSWFISFHIKDNLSYIKFNFLFYIKVEGNRKIGHVNPILFPVRVMYPKGVSLKTVNWCFYTFPK